MPGDVHIEQGWDSIAELVDGTWLDRRPRRPAVAEALRRECRFMPWLAPQLPLAVPVPRVLSDDPLVVRHALVPGEPLTAPTAAHGRTLGAFLRALHDVPVGEASARGLAPADDPQELAERFRSTVLPLVGEVHRPAAARLLLSLVTTPADTVVHGDLGPEHVLVIDDHLSGVIDFTDARIGDGALDLAWALHGTPREFGDAFAACYRPTDDQWDRALLWHRLGPWHAVEHGLQDGDGDEVRSGLDGVHRRLAAGRPPLTSGHAESHLPPR
jgi:aminoglycoside phosphotransferase (APT) family kinase protein